MDAFTGGQQPGQGPNSPHQPVFEKPMNQNKVYSRTFLFFGLALLITGCTALLGAWLLGIGVNPIAYYIAIGVSSIGIFILSLVISFKGYTMGNGLIVPYILYSLFMGILLSGCTFWVSQAPYVFGLVLILTAALFLLMCGIGLVIGKHVGVLGTLLIGALIGSAIIGLISFFTFPLMLAGNESLIPLFYIGEFVFIFVLLLYVAIDMFALKRLAESNTLVSTNMCIFFALRLYSDFITILIRILRIVAIALANKDN